MDEKQELLDLILQEENSEKIYEKLTNATKAKLRDISFECLCCIKLALVNNPELKEAMLSDIEKNLRKQWNI